MTSVSPYLKLPLRSEKTVRTQRASREIEVPPGHCPYPIGGDDGTAQMCVSHGHCGCDEYYALTSRYGVSP